MNIGPVSEDQFYMMIDEGMEQAVDHIASRLEYERFLSALARWVKQQEAEVERAAAAIEAEHPGQTF